MSCIYFLAKEEIPHITKYKPLLELPSHLGLPFLETLYKGNNATSTSHHIIEEFLSILADSVKSDLIAKLQKSPYGIICDETTDLSTTKQLFKVYAPIVSQGVL